MNGIAIAFMGYLLFNAISNAYYAGKGKDMTTTLSPRALKFFAIIYGSLAFIVLVFQ